MKASDVSSTVSEKFDQMGRPGEEGHWTQMIEHQTEKIPSGAFLAVGLGAVGVSLGLKAMGFAKTANFVGLWTPTILVMGLYNKLVKLEGSERQLH